MTSLLASQSLDILAITGLGQYLIINDHDGVRAQDAVVREAGRHLQGLFLRHSHSIVQSGLAGMECFGDIGRGDFEFDSRLA